MDDSQLQNLANKIAAGSATDTDIAEFSSEINNQLQTIKSQLVDIKE